MLINFIDNKITVNLNLQQKNVDENINILQPKKLNSAGELSDTNVNLQQSEIEQLQSNVLNSLNYASSQNVLPSTLPGQLNVKFLNTSTFDKLRDRITPSSIAQLEDPNTLYVSTKLLPQYQQDLNDC